jgi:2-dehydropantoate 2-reductase
VRLAVLGAGAIGAYVGAALARGGADVTLIARGAQLEALRTRGVRVLSPRGDFEAAPLATDDFEAMADADVVFLGLKAYHLPEVALDLGTVLRPDAAVIAAQNGIPWWYFQSHGGPLDGISLESVDPGGVVASAIGRDRVVGCVVYSSTELVEPGVVRHIEGTRFSLGEPDRSKSERCQAISAAFQAGGLKAPVEENLRDEIWLKLLGNATFNPVSALTRATLGELGQIREMRAMLAAAFEEIAAVAHALGIEFKVSLERRLEAGFAVGDHKTSMLQDLEHGKPLEYQCMTGAVIELARLLDLEVPRIQTLHACVELVDRLRPLDNRPMELAVARAFIDAVVAGNLDAAGKFLDLDVETVTPRGTLRGIAACGQVLAKAAGDDQLAMEQAEPELEQVEGDIVARTRETARWRETGEVAYERDFALRLTLDNERIVRVVVLPGAAPT